MKKFLNNIVTKVSGGLAALLIVLDQVRAFFLETQSILLSAAGG